MDLEEYLDINQTMNTDCEDPEHQKLLNAIENGLSRFGIDPKCQTYREVRLIKEGDHIRRVDMVALSKAGELYLFEGKVIRRISSGKISKTKNQINNQLRKAHRFLKLNLELVLA